MYQPVCVNRTCAQHEPDLPAHQFKGVSVKGGAHSRYDHCISGTGDGLPWPAFKK